MRSDTLHIVASYDISDPKRLSKVARAMKDYGERVLKSVFECTLQGNRFREMKERVNRIIEPVEDSIRFYILCDNCVRGVEHSGKGKPFQEDEEYVVI